MKHVIHTPTEQFGFVETELEVKEFTETTMALHKQLVEAAKPQSGIPSADFNAILDGYLTSGNISEDPGIMEEMSVEQVAILQAIKRSKKRTA